MPFVEYLLWATLIFLLNISHAINKFSLTVQKSSNAKVYGVKVYRVKKSSTDLHPSPHTHHNPLSLL